MTLYTWNNEEAIKQFNFIEKNKGNVEGTDLEIKTKLVWEDTTRYKNTTQKSMSGLANTFGGKCIIGFNKKGELVGWEEKGDIENTISRKLTSKLSPKIPEFKVMTYDYKKKKILVIFISKSKFPIRCDDGIYYYRKQSEFIPMDYKMLEDRFRKNFDEERYIYLTTKEIESLINTLKKSDTIWKIEHMTHIFRRSSDLLYNLYCKNNILVEYEKIRKEIDLIIAKENSMDPLIEKTGVQMFDWNHLSDRLEKFCKKIVIE